jgi:hypothetical protein
MTKAGIVASQQPAAPPPPAWLPDGAIAHLDFVNEQYYAGGSVRPVTTILGGGFDPNEIFNGTGMLIDWRAEPTGNTNRPDAAGALLADIDAALDNGVTFVYEMEGPYAPDNVNLLMILEGDDATTSPYYVAFIEGLTNAGQIYDSDVMYAVGPNGEINDGAGTPTINKFAFCLYRPEGGGKFGIAASVNGNNAFGDADVGIDGSTVVCDTVHIGHVDEFPEALGPDDYIRTLTVYGAKTDAELKTLST